MKALVAVVALLVVCGSAVGAERQVLHTWMSPNPENSGGFGLSVSGAGDANNDGYADLVVGACYENGGATDAGRAYIFSGQSGNPLHVLLSPIPEMDGHFGCSVSDAGDVNGDGHADVVVGADDEDGGAVGAGRAYVFSGQTGGPIRVLVSPDAQFIGHFGISVSGAGEVDGDGYADIVVGAHYEDGGDTQAGRAYIFSGQTGGLHYPLESPYPEAYGHFGIAVSGAGDVNNDGHADVVVGACYEDGGASGAGRAYVFSGETGDTLYTLLSPNPELNGYFGISVSGAGDVNGDGFADVVVGTYHEDGGATDAGRAYVFSGQTGNVLYTLQSPSPESPGQFGLSVSGTGDVDGDGYADVVVGACWEDGGATEAGRTHVFSGRTGYHLATLVSPNPEYDGFFGYSVSGAGDVNNDGQADVIVGAYNEDAEVTDDGRAYVFSVPPLMILSGSLIGGQFVLQWNPCAGAASYWVYGADNEAYFEPGLTSPYSYRQAVVAPPTTTWASANGVVVPDHNWTYLVVAVDAGQQEVTRSNPVGEFDFGLDAVR
jgi:hypothetical protein